MGCPQSETLKIMSQGVIYETLTSHPVTEDREAEDPFLA